MSRAIAELVRRELINLRPYEEPSLPPGVVRLHANENPYPFPDKVREDLAKELMQAEISRYPDPAAKELRTFLSDYTGWPQEQILVGNGSNELILTLLLTFGGPGSRIVIPVPTFSMYQIIANLTGATPVTVNMSRNYELDMFTLMEAAAHQDTKMILLCSPNNPTGGLLTNDQVREICSRTDAIVVLDEAYYEFAQTTALEMLQDIPNLVILRTFSKAFGLAGQRVGYLMANEPIVYQVKKASLPYNLNTFTQTAAKVALQNKDAFKQQIDDIIADREKVAQALNSMPGLVVYPSAANFILFKCIQKPAGEVFEQLAEAGVIIRYFNEAPGLENCLRVTIGTKEENEIFIEKLFQILKK